MYCQTSHRIVIGIVLNILGFSILLGVLLWLDIHRPWEWPMLFGIIWLLIISTGPVLIVLGTRFLILGYLDKYVFRIPPPLHHPGPIVEAPVQLKSQVRHCPHCKRQIPPDSKFCPYCREEV